MFMPCFSIAGAVTALPLRLLLHDNHQHCFVDVAAADILRFSLCRSSLLSPLISSPHEGAPLMPAAAPLSLSYASLFFSLIFFVSRLLFAFFRRFRLYVVCYAIFFFVSFIFHYVYVDYFSLPLISLSC